MINKLKIQNLQSHKDTELEFSSGVNVIVGLTDAGKSAIMNALYWLTWNRPMGDDYISFWGGEMRVEVTMDNVKIIRLKSNTKNEYKVGKLNLKAFGTEVPSEVAQTLNMSTINFKRQADDFFLLRNTAGEVAAHFNIIAHLDQIDIGISNTQRWIHNSAVEIKHNEESKKQLEEQLKEFAYLDKCEAEVEVLEKLQNDIITQTNACRELTTLIEDINELENEVAEQNKVLKLEDPVNTLLKFIEELRKIEEDHNDIYKLKNEIISIEEESKECDDNIKQLEQEFKDKFPDICPLCDQKVKK